MSDSIQVPNYDGIGPPLYLSRWSTDDSFQQDTLHQSGYLRVDDDDETQAIIGEYGYTNGPWYNFPVLDEFDNVDMVLKGAKIPITVTIVDDLGGEDEHDMGSTSSITLNPPHGRQYVSASIKRRL